MSRRTASGHQVADRAPAPDPVADLGGRDRERRDRHRAHAAAGGAVPRGVAPRFELEVPAQRVGDPVGESSRGTRARHHREVGQREQLLRLAPAGQLGECVAADDEDRARCGAALDQRAQRVDRVRRTAAHHLEIARGEPWVARARRLHPGQPLCARRERGSGTARLVRRLRRRHEQHAVEPERLGHLLRRAQVTQVDRIEGAAEHADPRHSRS
jgi:hypothetical protein